MNDTDVQAPKIEFPCERYPIKVIGEAGEGFTELIIEVMQRHAPDFDAGSLVIQAIAWRDYGLLQAAVLYLLLAFMLVTLAVDLLTGLLDPRVRYR